MDYEALERLARLRDSGALTEEEFAIQKERLLSGSTDTAVVEDEHRSIPRWVWGGIAALFLLTVGVLSLRAFGNLEEGDPAQAVRSSASDQNEVEARPIASEDVVSEPPAELQAKPAKPEPTPALTKSWLVGTWGPAEYNPTNEPNASCETDNTVTFASDGSFRDGGSYGKFKVNGSKVTYYDRILIDIVDPDTEDRSEFENPLVTRVQVKNQNEMQEDGNALRRCSQG